MLLMRAIAIPLVLALMTAPLSADSQYVADGEAARWHDVVERLDAAVLVTIRLKDGTRMKGTVLGVDPASFAFKPRTRIPVASRDIRFNDVVSIERTKQGMSPGQKVLIGAASVVGALFLFAAVALAGYD
jgi:hypothetical protein